MKVRLYADDAVTFIVKKKKLKRDLTVLHPPHVSTRRAPADTESNVHHSVRSLEGLDSSSGASVSPRLDSSFISQTEADHPGAQT